jgi:hypothetical protein
MGGPTVLSNLRVRCAGHNELHADRTYGEAFMGKKRARTNSGRSERAGWPSQSSSPLPEVRTP